MGSGRKVLTNAAGSPSKLSEWLNDLVSVRKRPLQRTGRQVICQLRAGIAEPGQSGETQQTLEDALSHVCSSLQFNLSHKDSGPLIHHVFYFARRLNLSRSRREGRGEAELLNEWKMGSMRVRPAAGLEF